MLLYFEGQSTETVIKQQNDTEVVKKVEVSVVCLTYINIIKKLYKNDSTVH